MRPQVETLEYEADPRPQAVDLLVVCCHQGTVAAWLEFHLFTGNDNLTGVGVFQQIDATQQRALAGAR